MKPVLSDLFYLRIAYGSVAFFFVVTSSLAQDCTSKPLAILPLTLTSGQLLISARVNGTDETMLLDTGAGVSALRDDVVENLGTPRIPIALNQVSDVGGRSFSQSTSAKTLEIGDLKLSDFPLLIEPRSSSREINDAGLVGADILHRYDVDFDFPKRVLKIFEPAHCLPSIAFNTDQITSIPLRIAPGGHLYIPLSLDGKDLEGLIDTGAAVSILTLDAFHRRFGLSRQSDGVSISGFVGGADRSNLQAYRYNFQQLSLNGLQLENPLIRLIADETRRIHQAADFGSQNVGLPDLILGMSELAQMHLYISYADNTLYISKPE